MRIWILSGLLATAAAAVGQAPPKADLPKTDPLQADARWRTEMTTSTDVSPAKGSVEEAILIALRNHPDIRLAEAKRQIAEAESDKAKLLVSQKVAMAYKKLDAAKTSIAAREASFKQIQALVKSGSNRVTDLLHAEALLQKAKGDLSEAEIEMRAAMGGTPRDLGTAIDAKTPLGENAGYSVKLRDVRADLKERVLTGQVADKLRTLVLRPMPVTLARLPFTEALVEVSKAVAADGITIKGPEWASKAILKEPPMVGPMKGEKTFVSWMQELMDEFNTAIVDHQTIPQHLNGRYDVYVREYGLLICKTQLAPPDAMSLTEFARQVRAQQPAGK